MNADEILLEKATHGITLSWRKLLVAYRVPEKDSGGVVNFLREIKVEPTQENIDKLRNEIAAALDRALEDFEAVEAKAEI